MKAKSNKSVGFFEGLVNGIKSSISSVASGTDTVQALKKHDMANQAAGQETKPEKKPPVSGQTMNKDKNKAIRDMRNLSHAQIEKIRAELEAKKAQKKAAEK